MHENMRECSKNPVTQRQNRDQWLPSTTEDLSEVDSITDWLNSSRQHAAIQCNPYNHPAYYPAYFLVTKSPTHPYMTFVRWQERDDFVTIFHGGCLSQKVNVNVIEPFALSCEGSGHWSGIWYFYNKGRRNTCLYRAHMAVLVHRSRPCLSVCIIQHAAIVHILTVFVFSCSLMGATMRI